MRFILPCCSRSAALPLVLLSTILAACSDGPAPLEPNQSVVEDSIEYMDPGQSYCDDDLWANGCTAVGDDPAPPPPPPGWEPCTNKPEGCYGDPGIGDPGDGGGWGGGGGAGGDGGGAADDSSPANDSDFDCHTWSTCELDEATEEQEIAMTQAITEHIVQSRCPELYATALSMVSTTMIWEEQITITEGDRTGTMRGDYVPSEGRQHIWKGNFSSPHKWLPWVLAHEAAHAIYGPDEDTADRVGDSCLNFTL